MVDQKLIKDEILIKLQGQINSIDIYDLEKIKEYENNISENGKKLLRKNEMYKKDRPAYKRKLKEYNRLVKELDSARRTYKYDRKNPDKNYYIVYGMFNMFRKFKNNDLFRKAKNYLNVLSHNQKNN